MSTKLHCGELPNPLSEFEIILALVSESPKKIVAI